MRRRRFLACAALSTGVPAASAGCLGDDLGPTTTAVDRLRFVNHADDGCDVSVTVTNPIGEGFVAYESSFRLGPASSDEDPAGNVTRDPDLKDFGAYVVETTVGSESLTVDTTEHVDESADCVRLKFERSPDGRVELVSTSYDIC
ncbi:hypothetical protein [Halobacterium rubrum]|jgi:hypothetical protein|uniref:hypothetical protein n=1 Tax=Halobacterium TaxID=2239 RepID=UPI001F1CF495|nr:MULTISPECIES: hypothetical protein [Halobacterium]MDH5019294.1 hypothetical protein [Halobacterium rubrum]